MPLRCIARAEEPGEAGNHFVDAWVGLRAIQNSTGPLNRLSNRPWCSVSRSWREEGFFAKRSAKESRMRIAKIIHFGLPRDLASSFFTRPAADESAAVFAPPPAFDPARHGSPAEPGEHERSSCEENVLGDGDNASLLHPA